MAARKKTSKNAASRSGKERSTGSYAHPEAGALLRPDVGTQAQFRKRKPPATWRYDPSRSPALDWAGKAERLSFDVPTLPLFVHERLSTAAILETLKGHTRDRQVDMFDLFGESDLPIHERLLKAYEHRNGWVNRLVLGDSLVVMNSLAGYEGLGGQVQAIYMDPPYAVKFGSNFQPFVRKRDVTHGDDEHMVREPEMVQAYRDTWELGIHSFLTYLRDRLLLARELLHPSGSIFVQMSDTNLHHVREVMDEVFGPECFVSQISFQTTSGFRTRTLATLGDFLLWYARDPERLKVRKLFEEQPAAPGEGNARWVLLPDGGYRGVKRGGETRGSAAPRGRPALQPRQLAGPGRVPRAAAFRVRGQGLRAGRQFALEAQLPGGARTPRRRGPDPRRGQQHPLPALRLGLPLQGAGQPLDRHPDRQLHGREDLRRPDQPQGRRTLPADDHRSGRLGVRPHLRLRDDRLVRGEVGAALDHRRHLPGAARTRPAAIADEHLRVLPAEGAGARPRRRLRVPAPAEPQGRGGRRHRAPRHPGVHRQRRAGAGRGAGGPAGDGRERHPGERPLLRGGDHSGPGGVGGGWWGGFG